MLMEKFIELAYRPLALTSEAAADVVDALRNEGLVLPEDYVEFLKCFPRTGVFDKEVVFHAEEPSPYAEDGLDSLNVLYAYDQKTTNDILKIRAAYADELPQDFLVIGEIEGGLPLCLEIGGGDNFGKIYIWNREVGRSRPVSLNIVGLGFSDFLGKLRAASIEAKAETRTVIASSFSEEFRERAKAALAARGKRR